MEIINLLNKAVQNIAENKFQTSHISNLLQAAIKKINQLSSKIESLSSFESQVSKNKEVINLLTEENKKLKAKLDDSLSHNEFLEPIFQKFKRESIGRLLLINIPPDTKQRYKKKIEQSEYSDDVIGILSEIELRFKEDFGERQTKTSFKKNSDFIMNPEIYKSGR